MEEVGTVTNVATEILAQTEAYLPLYATPSASSFSSSGHPQLAEEMVGNESSLWAHSFLFGPEVGARRSCRVGYRLLSGYPMVITAQSGLSEPHLHPAHKVDPSADFDYNYRARLKGHSHVW